MVIHLQRDFDDIQRDYCYDIHLSVMIHFQRDFCDDIQRDYCDDIHLSGMIHLQRDYCNNIR